MDKERNRMVTVTKPIRPTMITFEDDSEMNDFINYAKNTEKTKNNMERVRKMMQKHQPAKKRK